MSALKNTAPVIETEPETITIETIPDDPNDACGVVREIIEEIEEIGRKHAVPQK